MSQYWESFKCVIKRRQNMTQTTYIPKKNIYVYSWMSRPIGHHGAVKKERLILY